MSAACGGASDAASSADAIISEHSGDARTKTLLSMSDAAVLYCELPLAQPDAPCDPASSVAMSRAAYLTKLGAALDRYYPAYSAAIATAKANLDAASAALKDGWAASTAASDELTQVSQQLLAAAAPLDAQRTTATATRATLVARDTDLDGEIARIQQRLAAGSLSQSDHDLLTQKLADLTAEETSNTAQIAALGAQIDQLSAQINHEVNESPLLAAAWQKQTDAQNAVHGLNDAVEAATRGVASADGVRGSELYGTLNQIANPTSAIVVDAGDSTSKLVFDAFRSAPTFSDDSGCKTYVRGPIRGTTTTFDWRIQVDDGLLVPAVGRIPVEAGAHTAAVPLIVDRPTDFTTTDVVWEDFVRTFVATATWPKLAGLPVPTGTLTCSRRRAF